MFNIRTSVTVGMLITTVVLRVFHERFIKQGCFPQKNYSMEVVGWTTNGLGSKLWVSRNVQRLGCCCSGRGQTWVTKQAKTKKNTNRSEYADQDTVFCIVDFAVIFLIFVTLVQSDWWQKRHDLICQCTITAALWAKTRIMLD